MPARPHNRARRPRSAREARRARARKPALPPASVPTTWEGITEEFSTQDLRRLLLLSALLSADDTLGGRQWSELNTFKHLHRSLLQNFTRAVIASEAKYDSPATSSTADFLTTLINGVGHLQNHPSGAAIRHMDGPTFATDVISLIWRQQARLDGRTILESDLARAHAVLVHFPDRLKDQIAARQKAGYVHLDTHFKNEYGCSIDTVLQGSVLIYMRYSQIFNSADVFNPSWLQALRPTGGQMTVSDRALTKYVDGALPYLDHLTIPEQNLTNYLSEWLPREEIPHLLTLLSANIEELRAMLRESPFNRGIEAYAPLPLERKPLLKLPEDRYLIPNLRSMLAGMARLPLTLLANHPNKNIMTCYGQGLEAYAVAATTDRVAGSTITAIPEFRYKRKGSKNPLESADVTLIEPGKRPVLVEVKAKRLPDYGLALPGNSAFKGLDELITDTVIAGVQKAQDLSTAPPALHAPTLAAASREPGLVVIVYGESVPNFDGVFMSRIDATHPLRPHLGNFLPLSIAEYEYHLDIARERGESVIDLLQKSAEEFKDRHMLRMTSHSHLGDAWPKEPFLERYMQELLDRLSTPATSEAKD